MKVRVVSASLWERRQLGFYRGFWLVNHVSSSLLIGCWVTGGKVIIWHDTWYKWTNLTQSEHHHNSQQLSTKHTTHRETDLILNETRILLIGNFLSKKSQLKTLCVMLISEGKFCNPAFHQWSGEQWSGEHWGSYKCWESLFLSCNGGT